MIADSPPAVEACVKAAELAADTRGATFMVVTGKAAEVEAFLFEAAKSKVWTLASKSTWEGIETAVLRGPLQVSYREFGGLIFEGQKKRLAVTFATYPAVCEFEENHAQKN